MQYFRIIASLESATGFGVTIPAEDLDDARHFAKLRANGRTITRLEITPYSPAYVPRRFRLS